MHFLNYFMQVLFDNSVDKTQEMCTFSKFLAELNETGIFMVQSTVLWHQLLQTIAQPLPYYCKFKPG